MNSTTSTNMTSSREISIKVEFAAISSVAIRPSVDENRPSRTPIHLRIVRNHDGSDVCYCIMQMVTTIPRWCTHLSKSRTTVELATRIEFCTYSSLYTTRNNSTRRRRHMARIEWKQTRTNGTLLVQRCRHETNHFLNPSVLHRTVARIHLARSVLLKGELLLFIL